MYFHFSDEKLHIIRDDGFGAEPMDAAR
ncbi:hypothetical protein A2U01_0079354, partial [Trifolium medium]|nr:hypothetical protein [Trifolium medium]